LKTQAELAEQFPIEKDPIQNHWIWPIITKLAADPMTSHNFRRVLLSNPATLPSGDQRLRTLLLQSHIPQVLPTDSLAWEKLLICSD
jgi:hypothetical protein